MSLSLQFSLNYKKIIFDILLYFDYVNYKEQNRVIKCMIINFSQLLFYLNIDNIILKS